MVKQPKRCLKPQLISGPHTGCTYWIDSRKRAVFKKAGRKLTIASPGTGGWLPTPSQMIRGSSKKKSRGRFVKAKKTGRIAKQTAAGLSRGMILQLAKQRRKPSAIRLDSQTRRAVRLRKSLLKPCKAELIKHCAQAMPKERGWSRCLTQHKRRLSAKCQRALRAAK